MRKDAKSVSQRPFASASIEEKSQLGPDLFSAFYCGSRTYHMLSQKVSYNELGDLFLGKLNKNHLTRNLVHRLERLGYVAAQP